MLLEIGPRLVVAWLGGRGVYVRGPWVVCGVAPGGVSRGASASASAPSPASVIRAPVGRGDKGVTLLAGVSLPGGCAWVVAPW